MLYNYGIGVVICVFIRMCVLCVCVSVDKKYRQPQTPIPIIQQIHRIPSPSQLFRYSRYLVGWGWWRCENHKMIFRHEIVIKIIILKISTKYIFLEEKKSLIFDFDIFVLKMFDICQVLFSKCSIFSDFFHTKIRCQISFLNFCSRISDFFQNCQIFNVSDF